MKKFFTIIISVIMLHHSMLLHAQVNYSFKATTAPYTPVTGGATPVFINRPYDYNKISYTYDEGIANSLPIGFTFNYNGINYSSINICANGFATLGNPFTENLNYYEHFYINSLQSGTLSPSFTGGAETNTKPILAALWDDLNCQADSHLRYITTGTAGSRVFTFEWSAVKWQFDAQGSTLSFELKLYEGSNIIQFCYKDEGGIPNNASASIGLTANSQMGGGFLSLQSTSATPAISTLTEANNLSVKPADNQVYSFIPLPCSLPLNLHYNYSNSTVSFSWSAPAGVSSFEYVVDSSPADPASGIITSATTATVSSLTPGTKYYIHLRSYCSAISQSVWLTASSTTTKNMSPAPGIVWGKLLGGTDFETNGGIRQTKDGGYILSGSSTSNNGDVSGNHGKDDFWIVKLNSLGTIEWQKSFGGSNVEQATVIEETNEGGYIVVGYTQSGDGDVTNLKGVGDCWVVKLSAQGNIEWQRALGGSSVDLGISVEQTKDGGFIVAGATDSNNGDVSGNHDPLGIQPDIWIVKLNATGTIEWQKCLGGTEDEYAIAKQVSDGGYIVFGITNSTNGDVIGNHGSDGWVVKLDAAGNLQWQKCLGGSAYDAAYSLVEATDGGYIIAGQTSSADGDVIGDHSSGDVWILKLNNSGSILWQKYYGGSGSDDAGSIAKTSDGGYIVSGTTSSNDGDAIGNHGDVDAWLIKLNNTGDLQWQRCIGGSLSDRANYAEETTDNGYIVAGDTESNDGDLIGNHGIQDLWIVKLGPDALLPVSVLEFSGKISGKSNLLTWTTASEQNNTGFEVQRSADGYNFNKIGFVNSKAIASNSYLKLTYNFSDFTFTSATNYYRLKQIDKNGNFSFSNIVVLKNDKLKQEAISLYPNPVTDVLNIAIAPQGIDKITFSVTDIAGRVIQCRVTHASNSTMIVQLDVSTLPSGFYFLKIILGDGRENTIRKFVKE